MKRLLLIGLIIIIRINSVWSQTAASFFDPVVWLKTDFPENSFSYWPDISGNENHAISNSGDFFISEQLLNYNLAVSFNGSENYLQIPYEVASASQLMVITVHCPEDTSDTKSIWSADYDISSDLFLTTETLVGITNETEYEEGNKNLPIISTTAQYWGEASDSTDGMFMTLGALSNEEVPVSPFSGRISEYLVFDHILENNERKNVESYLSLKYGIPLYYTNYINSNDKIIWDFEENLDYTQNITGIGRDDFYSLHQKQSQNTQEPGLLIIAADKIENSNAENLYEIDKNNFLLWGDNGKEMSDADTVTDNHPMLLPLLNRKWLMDLYGVKAKDIPTQLKVDASQFIRKQHEKCWLVINRNATGDFSSNELEYILSDLISETGEVFFNDILWDNDNSDKDLFSFSFLSPLDADLSQSTNPLCHNNSDGVIKVDLQGGIPPYNFTLTESTSDYIHQWSSEAKRHDIEGLPAGTYKLAVTDSQGEYSEAEISLINPEPLADLQDEYYLFSGSSVYIDAGSLNNGEGVSYLWEKDDYIISNKREMTLYETGNYFVTVSKGVCQTQENFTILDNLGFEIVMDVYPNPASNRQFKTDIHLRGESDIRVQILNLAGTMHDMKRSSGQQDYQFEWQLKHAGVYFVRVNTSYGERTMKLIAY